MFHSNTPSSHSVADSETQAVHIQGAPLPILGSFADVWELRQDSDILLGEEAALEKKSSTAIFEQAQDGTDDWTTGAQTYQQYDQQQYAWGEGCQQDGSESPHNPVKAFIHNPYSLTQPTTEVVVCMCDTCCTSGSTTPRAMSFGPQEGSSTDYAQTDSPRISPRYVLTPRASTIQQEVCAPQQALSRFMPPAPPRTDTIEVLYACGAENADTLVYMMMTRWFNKVRDVQHMFVAETDVCPEPMPDGYSFAEWCQLANDWWKRNFAEMQKKAPVAEAKQQPSGGNYYNKHHHGPRQQQSGNRQQHNGWW